jgi:REP element-mobilizing transposase RayT
MSYTKLLYHIVLRTHRSTWAINETHERELYGYIWGICKNLGIKLFRIGGMPDHVHLLVSIPSSISLAQYVRDLKSSSSRWLKANPHFPLFEGWSREYAGFTYAHRDKDMIANYIMRQKEHHKVKTFAEEYRAFLIENGIKLDDRYYLRER